MRTKITEDIYHDQKKQMTLHNKKSVKKEEGTSLLD